MVMNNDLSSVLWPEVYLKLLVEGTLQVSASHGFTDEGKENFCGKAGKKDFCGKAPHKLTLNF